jgi:hypothetical protein
MWARDSDLEREVLVLVSILSLVIPSGSVESTWNPSGTWRRVVRCVEFSWNVMAHGDAREGKWRGNWRMEWVSSTLYTTSEHVVSSITTADAHTSAASSRLNWRPCRFKWYLSVSLKDEMWFLRVCHHISNAVYSTTFRRILLSSSLVWTILRLVYLLPGQPWRHDVPPCESNKSNRATETQEPWRHNLCL